jgi:hypothetical protein
MSQYRRNEFCIQSRMQINFKNLAYNIAINCGQPYNWLDAQFNPQTLLSRPF